MHNVEILVLISVWILKGTNQEENSARGRQTAERRAYFNINHLSNILTGFKNPILSILPLTAGNDYLPHAAQDLWALFSQAKQTEPQTGTDTAFSSRSPCYDIQTFPNRGFAGHRSPKLSCPPPQFPAKSNPSLKNHPKTQWLSASPWLVGSCRMIPAFPDSGHHIWGEGGQGGGGWWKRESSILYGDLFPLFPLLHPLNFKQADLWLCLSDRWLQGNDEMSWRCFWIRSCWLEIMTQHE